MTVNLFFELLDISSKIKEEKLERGVFQSELKTLMYGFGDVENPDPESIDLIEQYVIEYIQNVSLLAYKKSKRRGFNEIKLKDLLYIIKDDKKKFYRVPSLLSFMEILKGAKRKDVNPNKKGFKKNIKYYVDEDNK